MPKAIRLDVRSLSLSVRGADVSIKPGVYTAKSQEQWCKKICKAREAGESCDTVLGFAQKVLEAVSRAVSEPRAVATGPKLKLKSRAFSIN
jgi:hypothetical protein